MTTSHSAPSGPRLLGGRYRVEELLGEGASSVVWKAHDLTSGRTVAVKQLKRMANGSFAHSAVRFATEARILLELDDSHVVAVLDVGEDEWGTPHFVMEHLGAETLATLLERERALSPERALALLVPVGQALERLHARGIVHRDFKPQNVAIVREADGSLSGKLLDFGIAKTGGLSLTISGTTLGTPAYMAPEQALGTEVGPSCDIWSFGIVLYECLAGATPFEANSPAAMLLRIVSGQAPPLEDRAPGLSRALTLAVDRALRARPAQRYPDMTSFLGALEQARQAESAESPARGSAEPLPGQAADTDTHTLAAAPLRFEMKGIGFVNVQSYVREAHGSDALERVLEALAPADAELVRHALPVGWYPVGSFARLLRAIDRECGRGDLSLLPRVGAFEADQDFNRVLRIFLRIAQPSYVFNVASRLWQHFQSAGSWHIEKSEHAMLASLSGWAVDAALCAELTGYLARLFEFAGGTDVTCQHVHCRADGHESCDYDIRWR